VELYLHFPIRVHGAGTALTVPLLTESGSFLEQHNDHFIHNERLETTVDIDCFCTVNLIWLPGN
jgi:hypothetical protein